METPQAAEDKRKTLVENKIQFLREIITASARYERLNANQDFIDILNDLKNIVAMHKAEIEGYLTAYSLTSSFFKKMRLAEVMGQHQMRMQQIQEAISYPASIIQKAVDARTEIAKLIELQKEIANV